FFVQAEDGIRDFHVTGVRTCALPIYETAVTGGGAVQLRPEQAGRMFPPDQRRAGLRPHEPTVTDTTDTTGRPGAALRRADQPDRSEERRVGNEGGDRGEADRWKSNER